MLMRELKRLSFAAPALDRQSKYTVSAVLQVRNEASTIEETLEALLGQHGVDMQVIVVDDASTDDTCEKLEAMANEDARLNILRQKKDSSWLVSALLCF
jgi:glycosyltransferase involved in cell wall biosynthesis